MELNFLCWVSHVTNLLDKNRQPMQLNYILVWPAPWEEFWPSKSCLWEPKHGSDVRWNFEKWLIAKDGTPFRRYHSYTEPYNLEQDIKYLLDQADEPSKEGSAIDYHENRRKPKDFLFGGTMEQEDMD